MTYPPHNPDDEPRSEPFTPVSYDLAPEFGTPPPVNNPGPYQTGAQPVPPVSAQPPYPVSAQPGYPVSAAPAAYPPPPPGYPQQPVYPQQPAYAPAPPPPPKKGKALKITLSVIGGVFLVCAIATCVFFYPILSESAHVTAPATLPGGLTKEDSATSDQLATSAESSIRREVDNIDEVVTGVYKTEDDDPGKIVILVAAAGTFTFPDDEVKNAFKGFDTASAPQTYDAGSLGGTVKCADDTLDGANGTEYAVCVWADHGSIGVVMFFGRKASEAAPQFVQIREQVQSRS